MTTIRPRGFGPPTPTGPESVIIWIRWLNRLRRDREAERLTLGGLALLNLLILGVNAFGLGGPRLVSFIAFLGSTAASFRLAWQPRTPLDPIEILTDPDLID